MTGIICSTAADAGCDLLTTSNTTTTNNNTSQPASQPQLKHHKQTQLTQHQTISQPSHPPSQNRAVTRNTSLHNCNPKRTLHPHRAPSPPYSPTPPAPPIHFTCIVSAPVLSLRCGWAASAVRPAPQPSEPHVNLRTGATAARHPRSSPTDSLLGAQCTASVLWRVVMGW